MFHVYNHLFLIIITLLNLKYYMKFIRLQQNMVCFQFPILYTFVNAQNQTVCKLKFA